MKIKKMLFVTKFESLCYDALHSLLDMRKSGLEHVVFLNVIEREKVSMRRGKGYAKEDAVRLKEMANIRFIDWAENLFELGMEVGAYIEVSSLIPKILEVVDKEKPDLIVIGRSQKGKLEQLYSRSDITELTRRSPVPILVFKHLAEDKMVPAKLFERPLFATSWSNSSEKAVDCLKELGEVIGELHLMHVVDEDDLKSSDTHEVQSVRKKERTRLEDLCDEFAQKGISARPHVYVGDPETEILKAAREYQATLVVLGFSDRTALAERWLGSISRNIADKSVYPCLLFPVKR
ncbi:universal stress protein [Desulfotignum phosphitoxidans]|jgi:nucleotide-binding universal stress UspA family protein|uniref:UspA domain-containing protein n=2 Tax=Desulfotignum TaxID=115780 RepID=S0FZA8_9BACT|nr:universal stress protein [Desulfotignum phosphitoxidans]EMS80000.1 UspA domain-containing protein [Desulfotignum phosphitoxidans DSM 13687]